MIKYFDLKNWNLFRVLRLILSFVALIAYFKSNEILYAVIGLLLFVQVLFNMGCGIGSCNTYKARKNSNSTDDITYEEIK